MPHGLRRCPAADGWSAPGADTRQGLSVSISPFQIILRIPARPATIIPLGLPPGRIEKDLCMNKRHATKPDSRAGAYRRILLERRQSVLVSLGAKAGALIRGDRVSEEDQA